MSDEELRTAFHALAEEDLPPDFIDRVLRLLPDRRPYRRLGTIATIATALVGVAAFVWLNASPRLGSDVHASFPAASPGPSSPSGSPVPSAPDAAGGLILSIEITPGGATGPMALPNAVVFTLDGNGRAVYHDYVFGESRSEARVAYLSPEQVRELIAFAIGPGGMSQARSLYERNSFGPSGRTIIKLDTPQLAKTVEYGLAPGNLVRDEDPTLGGLPDLVARLSHFSSDVERGTASGGLLLTEAERAESIALDDPRFRDLLASAVHVTDRVLPAPTAVGHVLVYVSVSGDDANWPAMDACEIDGSDGPATGIVWQVDLAASEVVAVSPRWDSVDCLTG